MAVEKASYKVIVKDGNFEVRFYDPMIVLVSQVTDLNGTSGFNRLFNYISGSNQASRKIAMTAPVINNLRKEQLTISFVMPKEYRLEELPQPLDSKLQFRTIPERYITAITFSGNINKELIAAKKQELMGWLEEKHIAAIGSIELARYNPPFIPGFIKRNELLIEVNRPIG